MADLFLWFNETKQAFESGNPASLFVTSGLLIVSIVLKWKDIWLPKYRLKFLILALFGFITIELWSFGLLNGLMLYFVLVLLGSLILVFYYSSHKLLWPCSLVDCEVSNFLMANEPEKAEQMLYYYRRCFLDSTGKYSYNIQKAAIAAAKGDISSSIEIISKIDKKTLNEDENLRLELRKAGYFSQLGDFKKAKRIVENLPECPDKYLLQVYLIQALTAEVEGNLKKSSELLLEAINICSDHADVYYQVALNNMGRIRRLEENYEDSLYYYQRKLKAVKYSRNRTSIHIAYRNVIGLLTWDHKLDEADKKIQEYHSFIDSKNPNDLLEYYNCLLEHYRQTDDHYNLSKIVEELKEKMYPNISRKEQLMFDISVLRIRWNNKLLSQVFLNQIGSQYTEYSDFSPVEKFKCFMEIHNILQDLSEIGLLSDHINLYNTNKENIRIIIPGLENYLYTIPEYCISEKCETMWNIVRAKTCNVDYDRDEVLRMLKDIKKTYSEHGNFIGAFSIGLDICDEACGQKKYEEMWEFTQLAIDEIQRLFGHPVATPAFLRIACYAYIAGKIEISRKYMGLYEKTGIHISNYSNWIQNYYYGIKQKLDMIENLQKTIL